jgi:predicted transcriptional regulator
MREKRIEELMTTGIVAVAPYTPVGAAREVARERRVRHLLITKQNDLVGVACACDLAAGSDSQEISRFMASPVVTIEPDAPLEAAAELMRTRLVGCLPVVSRARVTGIVTRRDLQRIAGFSDEELGILRCASCGWHHNVISRLGTPETGFCLYCRERSVPPTDDDVDLGGCG